MIASVFLRICPLGVSVCYCRFSENPLNFVNLEIILPIRHKEYKDHGLRPWHRWCQEKNWAECSAPRWKEKRHKRFLVVKIVPRLSDDSRTPQDPLMMVSKRWNLLKCWNPIKFQDISCLTSVGGEHLFFPSFLGGPRLRQRFVLKREDAKQVREVFRSQNTTNTSCVCFDPSFTKQLATKPLGPPLKMGCNFPQNPLQKNPFEGFM